MKYNELTLGQVEAIVNKLGGTQGVCDFLSGKTTVRLVEQVLEVWKTIKLGTGARTADNFCQAITDVGGQVSKWAKDIMGKADFVVSVSQEQVELDLCVKTTEEILGEKGRSGTLKEIYAGIARMGGEMLPDEAGPQLRRQYTNQPNGEYLLMAMEPIKDSDGDLSVFHVRRFDGAPWLGARHGDPGRFWDSDCRWVFARLRCK